MAIDHTRDFVHSAAMNFQPEDLRQTTAPIFFTRWITHFCAPAFMFCAGLGAWFRLQRSGATALSTFLWTRGLWLIILELTVVRLAFFFNVSYDLVFLLVFWALGLSMIALAAFVRLPHRVTLAIGLAMVCLHNLADGVRVPSPGVLASLWTVLHQPGLLISGPPAVIVGYPVVPWIGVMALGFCAGSIFEMPDTVRRRTLLRLGLVATISFVGLRALDVYGDPRPWSGQDSALMTFVSFLNTTKYPPSLSFLLMTLGPALIFLALTDRWEPGRRHALLVFGRAPLVFFVLHLVVIHAIAIGLTAFSYGSAPFLFLPPPTLGTPRDMFPAGYGWSLGVVYLVWLVVLAVMYPICAWFVRVRQRQRHAWLSYF